METERLTFRHWKEEDAPLLYSYAKDPDIGPLCGWMPHQDEEESRNVILHVFNTEECRAIVLKETGLPIGTIELKKDTPQLQSEYECEVGCWLARDYWRKGIMSEATQWVLKRAFEELGMKKVYWCWFEGNTASEKTAEKAGFQLQYIIKDMEVPLLKTKKTICVSSLSKERYEQLHPSKEQMIQIYEKWEEKLNAYHFAMTLIGIDANDRPPLDGAEVRNRHTSLLASDLFRIEKDPQIPSIIEKLLKEKDLDPVFRRRLELRFKGIERMKNVPEEAYSAFRKALVESEQAWLKYKQTADWNSYYPYLEKLVNEQMNLLSYRKDSRSNYDILLDDNEEGWNTQRYDAFFDEVKKELVPLIHAISGKEETDDSFLHQSFDIDEQRKLMKEILEYLGFTEKWGKLGESEHPLTTWIAENDVRITTKYREHDAAAGILSTVHETGHAWFVHNVDEKYDGTLIVSGISAAMHESQSRLCENHLGRTEGFWKANYPKLQKHFPEQLGNISFETFMKALNKVKATYVRTEADELTYPLHILIRYEIEKELFSGNLQVKDLETVWNRKYKEYLGLDVPDAKQGILQDMHWPYAYFGYFPTYALGSAFAAQINETMKKQIDVQKLLEESKYETIMAWLKEHVQKDGAMNSSLEVIEQATGELFNPANYTAYLKEKYTRIYNL